MNKHWFIFLLALLCNLVPLAYLDVASGQWIEGSRGAVVVDEHLKFAAFIFLGSLPVVAMCLVLAQGRPEWHLPRGYLLPVGLLVAACLFSSVSAKDTGRHWMTAWQVFVLPVLLFLAIGSQKWKKDEVVWLMLAMLPAGTVAAFTGLDQFYGWDWTAWGDQFPKYGLGSMFFSPNLAAEYLALLLPLAAACVVVGRSHWKWVAALAGVAMLLFFILTKARAAWVGLLVGVILAGAMVLLVVWRNLDSDKARPVVRRIVFCAGGLAGGFLILLLLTPYWAKGKGDDLPGPTPPLQADRFVQEFRSILKGQSNARLEIWEDSWRMAGEESGLFGVGAGQFRIQFPRFIKASHGFFVESLEGTKFKQTRRAHNDYLQLLTELGWFGLVVCCWLWLRVIFGACRTVRDALTAGDWPRLFVALCLMASVLVLAVAMFFDFPARMPATIAIGWICLGLLVGMEKRKSPKVAVIGNGQSLLTLLAIFVLFASGSLGWRTLKGDFYRVQGLLANQQGDRENAIRFYEVARENVPWEESPWFHLHWLYRQDFKMEKALEVAREHLERNPWYYPSMIHEKDCLMQMGRWEEARASVRHIMETFPSHPHAEALRHSVGLWD